MPEMFVDVDAAVTVPVNLLPLLDDTDYKSRETGVAYNAAGMDLVWNFITTAGVMTQTAVTPTTSGDYDWTHVGDGMYKIEIPASGGASINNDTEGFGWFTGVATGVLPWRGPVIGFRAAGLNNLLIDSAFSTTRGLAGTALPDAAAGAADGVPTLSSVGIYKGTITGASPTTTTLVDSGLTQSDDDHWNGRTLIFTSGSLRYQATDITDFDAATDTLTFTGLTNAPAQGDTYIIV